jgi:hypothetical protein
VRGVALGFDLAGGGGSRGCGLGFGSARPIPFAAASAGVGDIAGINGAVVVARSIMDCVGAGVPICVGVAANCL